VAAVEQSRSLARCVVAVPQHLWCQGIYPAQHHGRHTQRCATRAALSVDTGSSLFWCHLSRVRQSNPSLPAACSGAFGISEKEARGKNEAKASEELTSGKRKKAYSPVNYRTARMQRPLKRLLERFPKCTFTSETLNSRHHALLGVVV